MRETNREAGVGGQELCGLGQVGIWGRLILGSFPLHDGRSHVWTWSWPPPVAVTPGYMWATREVWTATVA